MIAEILATGDEVTTGSIVDSNSAYIAEKLEANGIDVIRHTSVKDDLKSLISIIEEMSFRCDIAVVTGGLGPTVDDITAEAAAKAAKIELVHNKDAQASMEVYFKTRNLSIAASNNKQAFLPAGAECIHNPVGTAPGFIVKINQCRFYFMPGVPYEMKKMMNDFVIPNLKNLKDDKQVNKVKTMSLFGLGEASVNENLAGFENVFPEIKLGLRAVFPIINIKFYASGNDEAVLQNKLTDATEWTAARIGNFLISDDGSSMEYVVGNLLLNNKATVSVAESCTGGLISHMLTNVAGSSGYFLFSGVTYSNEAKTNIINVAKDTIDTFGAVSDETVKEMAMGVKKLTGSTYGVATSGIAGPDGGTEDKPVGTVCIGIVAPDETIVQKFYFPLRKRSMNKTLFAVTALDMLRRTILGLSMLDFFYGKKR